MTFYSEKDQNRVQCALDALQSMDTRPKAIDDVIQVLSGEKNEARSVAGGSSDFLDETAVYECLANLIREVHNIHGQIMDIHDRLEDKQPRRKWWFA